MNDLVGLLDAGPPDATAVIDPDGSLSRHELRDLADRLGTVLEQRGVAPGDRVGVHLDSSVAAFVAVHGILRRGAVVVPVDPRAPAPHVAAVLADCGASVVVGSGSERRWAAIGELAALADVVDVDDAASAPPAARREVDPDDPAYIITTSGSTGRPKGIVHTHRSGAAYARLAARTYGLGPADRVATLSPLHFDQSTFSLYAAPLAGAAALVVPDAVMRFPASVSEVVAEHRATVWYSVPSLLVQLLRRGALERRDLSHLRWVLYGGEAFDPAALRELMAALPQARVSNVYGPAEVNQCTFHHLDAPPGDGPVPIGRAWDETEIALVADGEAAGDGQVGELLVRSSTAMAGYWNQPEVTSAAFRTWDGRGGWYATGDLARRRDDGALVFVGRVDNQVKVRGQRVELEAVDAALAALDGAEAAVAVVEPDDEGGRLVGLVEGAIDVVGARRVLSRRLPAAAVPAEIIQVDRLPRTSTGKADRPAAARTLAPR